MLTVDPLALARRQLALDRAKTARFPALLDRKIARMTASPLALLRGSAPLFYEILATHPSLAEGPRGKGWLAGDLHLENFGAYRAGPDEVRFDLNDFDDAVIGPWRLDVLRLTTSLILGGRELGADGPRVLGLAHELIDAYVAAAFAKKKALPKAPPPVSKLMAQVTTRTREQLLDARTEVAHHARRFVRGERYVDLPEAIAKRVDKAFARYVRALDERLHRDDHAFRIVDAAWRIAGCGSLGGLRIAILVEGKGGEDGAWIFDMKEQGAPSAQRLLGKGPKRARLAPAERVCAAMNACLTHPPRLIGTTAIGELSMFVRRLAPQEDKLDLTALRDGDLDALATFLGALVGRAHARGAEKKPRAAWSRDERDAIVDRAIAIAGVHEATYLALCKLTRSRGPR